MIWKIFWDLPSHNLQTFVNEWVNPEFSWYNKYEIRLEILSPRSLHNYVFVCSIVVKNICEYVLLINKWVWIKSMAVHENICLDVTKILYHGSLNRIKIIAVLTKN